MQETSDGFGSRMHNIIALMAFAAKHEMNFGGIIAYTACNQNHFDNTHGEDIERLVKGVLGLDDPNDIFTDFEPSPLQRVEGIDGLLAKLKEGAYEDEMNVILRAGSNNAMAVDLNVHGVANY